MVSENAKKRSPMIAILGAIMVFLTVISCSMNEEKPDLMTEVCHYNNDYALPIVSKVVSLPYIFLNASQIQILKLTDTNDLQIVNIIPCWYESPDMEIKDSVIYFLHDDYLFLMSVNDMENPVITDSIYLSDEGVSLELDGNILYLLTSTKGLTVYSLYANNSISKIGGFEYIEDSKNMELIEDRLYISCGNRGWMILDVTDPENPAEIYRVETTGWTLKTALKDSVLYTAEWDKGVNVYLLKEDGSADSITNLEIGYPVKEVNVNGNYLYISGEYGNCNVYDITKPTKPVFYAENPTDNSEWDDYLGQLIFENEYVYASCYYEFGIFKLKY